MAVLTGSNIDRIHFKTVACCSLTDEELAQCKALFDGYYGTWGEGHPEKGKRIRFPQKLYQKYREMDHTYVALALEEETIVGQAFYLKRDLEKEKTVAWVLQLVVREDYRKRGIAKTLLYSIWGFSDDHAWGLATSNALTVKTLEKATFRKVHLSEMERHKEEILMIKETIPFARDAEWTINAAQSVLNSAFPVDRSVIDENFRLYEGKWELGELPIGYEWLAFTFQDQSSQMSQEEYDEMFANSEKIVNDAYNRMDLPAQSWNRHHKSEVDFILRWIGKNEVHNIIDFGCGNGRHAMELARRGYQVLGVDYSEKNIRAAKRNVAGTSARFLKGDCRSIDLEEEADLALCLYDVIGSFARAEDNRAIIRNIYRHLRSAGRLVMSVMNLELTAAIAVHKVPDVRTNLDALARLKPSKTMQQSGNIFNPEYFLLETDTGVVYRKEQFENEDELSAEYAIRDKRYSLDEISGMLDDAGFRVLNSRYVQAGHWEHALLPNALAAKEILILAEKV